MKSNEQITDSNRSSSRPRMNFELYYYEQIGSRFYLRVTPFAFILIILSMTFGIGLILLNSSVPTPKLDLTIKPRDTSHDPAPLMIHQLPRPPIYMPPIVSGRAHVTPRTATPSTRIKNINEQQPILIQSTSPESFLSDTSNIEHKPKPQQ